MSAIKQRSLAISRSLLITVVLCAVAVTVVYAADSYASQQAGLGTLIPRGGE